MIIGIISDTHNSDNNIEKAFNLFVENKVELIIHCGDWTKLETLNLIKDLSKKFKITVKGVLGNNDSNLKTLNSNKIISQDKTLELRIDNKSIAIYHGENKKILNDLIEQEKYNIIFTGHTHKIRDEKINNTRIINPGSVAFTIPRSKSFKTVAIYNTAKDEVNFLNFN